MGQLNALDMFVPAKDTLSDFCHDVCCTVIFHAFWYDQFLSFVSTSKPDCFLLCRNDFIFNVCPLRVCYRELLCHDAHDT